MMLRVVCLGLALVCAPSVSLSKLGSLKSHDVQSKAQTSSSSNVHNINPRVYQLAVKAHQRAKRMGVTKKPVMTIIDYSLPSSQPRMWVIDTVRNKVMFHTHVAHGNGSGGDRANSFSDVPGSYQTSLGVFVTGATYQGKHGTSLTLHGLEKGINGNALQRRIVVHGANYVSEQIIRSKGRLGRSQGCPALNNKIAQPIIQTIKDGSMVFAYYPDEKWLKRSTFLS